MLYKLLFFSQKTVQNARTISSDKESHVPKNGQKQRVQFLSLNIIADRILFLFPHGLIIYNTHFFFHFAVIYA